jgi:hypothetical protein
VSVGAAVERRNRCGGYGDRDPRARGRAQLSAGEPRCRHPGKDAERGLHLRHAAGYLRSKQDVLKAVATGNIGNEYLETSDLKIRVYADTAVVTGRALQTAQRVGKDFTDSYRFTRVFVRRGGQWLAVALQMTRLDGF